MIINVASIEGLYRGFSTAFNQGFEGATSHYRDVAMIAPSSTAETTYAWMGQLPRIREWLGDRYVNSMTGHSYTIVNRDFELTIGVDRNKIEDDQYGIFTPIVREMGREAAEHPDRLVFNLLNEGFSTVCHDGQFFFDIDHPVASESGEIESVSNFQGGEGPAWFLLDTSRALRPIIYQERKPFEFTSMTDPSDERVFRRREFMYGVSGRSNVGFGLWQLAYASKQTLNPTNYALARAAMHAMRGDNGRRLGIRPTTLVVPTALEQAGLKIINNRLAGGGEENEWYQTAELIVTPWLDA